MAARRITGTAVFLILIATTAGTLAGWNAYSRPADKSAQTARVWTQSSNTGAKGDRMAHPAQPAEMASADERNAPAVMMLASVDARSIAPAELWATTPARTPAVGALPPPPKPKAPPPSGLFDEGQIAGLKSRLRLTAEQAEYWPAVEVALRNVIRQQAREMRKRRHRAGGSAPPIDVNSAEVQQLIAAALPLIMQLREDQKREVRQLARVIGLEQVARQI